MIRVYGFYSCGGYKDMYLGSSERCDRPSYYLPLHPVMKKRLRPDDLPKIEQQEKLMQIGLVSCGDSMGFPDECNAMFSHGGYVTMYRMLSDGSTCLAMRDIPSAEVDEVGRNIPFNLLLIATSVEDIAKLDQMAVSVKDHYAEWRDFATSLFAYDPIVNGLRFDLPILFERMAELPDMGGKRIDHTLNTLVFLMLTDVKNIKIALREQNLQQSAVRCIVDAQGQVLQGYFPIIERSRPKMPDSAVRQGETDESGFEKEAITNIADTSGLKEKMRELEELEQIALKLKDEIGRLTEEVGALRECRQGLDAFASKMADTDSAEQTPKKSSLFDVILPKKYTQYKEDYLLIGVIIVILLLIF